MGKIDKKELTRGTKLTNEHVWDNNLTKVQGNLNTANVAGTDGIIQPQYENGQGTFRVTWTLPKLTSRWTRCNGPNAMSYNILATASGGNTEVGPFNEYQPYIIPFVLPPLQEYLSYIGLSDTNTPQIYLEELSFGFDTKGEAGFITDEDSGPGSVPAPSGGAASTAKKYGSYVRSQSGAVAAVGSRISSDNSRFIVNQNHGKVDYNIHTRGSLRFEILGKDMTYFNPDAGNSFTDRLYDIEVPIAGFVGRDLRTNPAIESGINLFMDPYKTYALAITPPTLHDVNVSSTSLQENFALVNLTISLKFSHRLVDRDFYDDSAATVISGIPDDHDGKKTTAGITLSKPGVSTTIEADSADGLNTSLSTIDQVFQDKLRSGYDRESNTPPKEEMCQDSTYDIIAIPLWNNQAGNMVTMRDAVSGILPYHCGGWQGTTTVGGIETFNGISMEDGPMTRAIVPIDYPMTIHHAFLAMNCYTANFNYNGSSAVGHTDPATEHMFWDAWDLNLEQYPRPAGNRYKANVSGHDEPITEIGLGVGTGLRGTQYGYRQVLHYQDLRLNNDNVANNPYVMDKIQMPYRFTAWDKLLNPLTGPSEPNWRIYNLPLNGLAGAGAGVGNGFYATNGAAVTNAAGQATAQDRPHFVGNSYIGRKAGVLGTNPMTAGSISGTSKRQYGSTGATLGMGGDQWLEVRWKTKLKNFSAGTATGWDEVTQYGVNATNDAGSDSKVIHGVGGHWLYLVVKKAVVSNANMQDINLKGGI
jgi:hypothetical protein